MNVEMHYSTAGHHGAYFNLTAAIERARLLFKGNERQRFIDLTRRSKPTNARHDRQKHHPKRPATNLCANLSLL
jgi:hypothetical protein